MFNSSDMYQLVHATRGCLSDMYIISKTLVNIYTPRSLANGTGEIVLPKKDNEIGGSLLINHNNLYLNASPLSTVIP